MLKDEWFYKSFEIVGDMLEVVLDENNDGKAIRDKIDRRKLRESLYWLDIDKYDKKKADEYLKLYADGDERWRDAFAEVIYLL